MPLMNGINEVCKAVQRIIHINVSAGISAMKPNLHQLRDCYQEALRALNYSTISGSGKAVYISDVEPDVSVKMEFSKEDENEIVNVIKMGDEKKIREKIDEVFSCPKTALPSLNQYRIYLLEVITSILKVISAFGFNSEGVDENFPDADAVSRFHDPVEMKKWCLDICLKLSSKIRNQRVSNTKMLARRAEKYIKDNYSNPELSVEDLCLYLHVSPAYFSTVFKRETGKSFVSYLTDVRLQQAASLLNTTEDKSYIIAQKVGYFEPNYFSYVFKKKYGVSPSKYRRS